MHIDGRALARAAEQLDTALRHVDAAQRIDAPLVVGRARAKEAVQTAFGDAHDWATSASHELRRGGSATADARIAVDRLATEIDAIRFQRDVLSTRNGEAIRASVDGARQWTTRLETLRGGTQALEQGTAHAWFTRTLAAAVDPDDVLSARAIAEDARIDVLGPATSGFLRRLEPAYARSLELARIALSRGGATASSELLDDLLWSARDGIDLDLLRAALRGLDDGMGDGARRLPTWLGEHASGTLAPRDIQMHEIELLRRLDDPTMLATEARQLLARPVPELARAEITRLAAMTELPAHARPALADSTIEGWTLADALRGGRPVTAHLHRMWGGSFATHVEASREVAGLLDQPASADIAHRLAVLADIHPAGVFGEAGDAAWRSARSADLAAASDHTAGVMLDTLALHRTAPSPAELDAQARALLGDAAFGERQLRSLAAIAHQPDGVRPALLDDARESLLEAARTGTVTEAIEDLRWSLERHAITADPNGALRAIGELQKIIAKPTATLRDLRRVHRLGGLPEAVRPDLPNSVPIFVEDIDRAARSPAWVRNIRNDLRYSVVMQRIARDPATTPRSILDQLDGILAKADDDITREDLRWISVLEELPERLRPELPDPVFYSRRRLVDEDRLPAFDSDSSDELRSLRTWNERRRIEEDPSITPSTLLAEVDSILAKADDDVTLDDLRRLALLDEVRGTKRPGFPAPVAADSPLRTLADDERIAGSFSGTRAELANLRLWRDGVVFAQDPSTTRQAVSAQLDDILARHQRDVTLDDMRQIAMFEQLPPQQRPTFPAPVGRSVRDLFLNGEHPAGSRHAWAEFGHLRRWNAARNIVEDPAVTRATLQRELDAILGKADDHVTIKDLQRLSALDVVEGDKALGLPPPKTYSRQQIADTFGLPTRDGNTRAELSSLRRWRDLQRIEEDPAITRQTLERELDEMLAKQDHDIITDDLRRLAAIGSVGESKRPDLPDGMAHSLSRLLESDRVAGSDPDALRELDNLRNWNAARQAAADPAVTRETLTAELDDILARSDDDITIDDLRRVVQLEMVPVDKRPELPPVVARSRLHLAEQRWLPGKDDGARREFLNLRLFREARRLADDPAASHETIVEEMRAIASKADSEIGLDDMRRLFVLERAAAGKDPQLPAPRGSHDLWSLLHREWSTAHDKDAHRRLESVRSSLLRRELLDDPANSREALTEQIRRIVLKPDDQITIDDLRRLVLIDELPKGRRPVLPPPATNYPRRRMLEGGILRSHIAPAEVANLRSWAQAQTDAGREAARQRLHAGENLDAVTITALVAGGEQAMQRSGLSLGQLLHASVSKLREPPSPGDTASIKHALVTTRLLLTLIDPDDAVRPLADEAAARVQRNIDRIEGRLHDGYSTYPDYAELGRAAETVELLAKLRSAAAASTSVDGMAGTADAATAARATHASGELVW